MFYGETIICMSSEMTDIFLMFKAYPSAISLNDYETDI